MARNVCIFAHYDAHDRLEPYVLHYVQAITRCGFDVIFVSTSALAEDELEILRPLCNDTICRPNSGMDFGSWAVGYAKHGRGIDGELLLVNDSVYLVGDLRGALHRLRALSADFKGMVESLERRRHIQSWFVLFSADTHRSLAFQEIITQAFTGLSKAEIIARGELKLSLHLSAAGFSSAALFSMSHRERDGAIVRYNPMHFIWKDLIETFGIPFLKVELLRDNPAMISDLQQWRDVVMAKAPEMLPMIEAHLQHAMTNQTNARAPVRLLRFKEEAFVRRHLKFDRRRSKLKGQLNKWIFTFARACHKILR